MRNSKDNQANQLLSPDELSKVRLLLVEPDVDDGLVLKEMFLAAGVGAIALVNDHGAGLKLLLERRFSHVVFAAKESNVPVLSFVSQMLSDNPEAILIPSSYEPNVDKVFELLRRGCRGFLVLPCREADVLSALAVATRTESLSPEILNAVDRNAAFSALVSSTLDRLAEVTKAATKYESAKEELPDIILNFRSCLHLGRTFAEGGEEELQKAMFAYFEKISAGPATRLGRLRGRLAKKRGKGNALD